MKRVVRNSRCSWIVVKVAQINYVSRNQLHCTANLNFGLMRKKAKHCWALSTNFLFLFSWYFFLIMFCFLLNWRKNSNYFKIAVWWSDSMKGKFRGFTFTNFHFSPLKKPWSWTLGTLECFSCAISSTLSTSSAKCFSSIDFWAVFSWAMELKL